MKAEVRSVLRRKGIVRDPSDSKTASAPRRRPQGNPVYQYDYVDSALGSLLGPGHCFSIPSRRTGWREQPD